MRTYTLNASLARASVDPNALDSLVWDTSGHLVKCNCVKCNDSIRAVTYEQFLKNQVRGGVPRYA